MTLELDEETLAELGWSSTETTERNERSTQSIARLESPEAVKARVYAWWAANPGWWRRNDSWRKSEAGKESSRRAGARYRAKRRAQRAQEARGATFDTQGGPEHG